MPGHSLRALVDSTPSAVVATDLDGRVTMWNPAAEQLFGWRSDDVLGRPDPVLGDADRTRPSQPLTSRPDGDQLTEELRLHRDGHPIDVDVRAAAIRDDAGATVGWITVYNDSGDRLRLQYGLRQRLREQAAVAELGHLALSTGGTTPLLDRVVDVVAATLLVPSAAVVRHHGPDQLVLAAAYGLPWPAGQVVAGSGAAQALREAGRPEIDALLTPGGRFASIGLRSSASVTLGDPDAPWALLCCFDLEPHRFTSDDLLFLQSVGTVVTAAVARRRAEAQLRHRATHDSLTGLPNREALRDRLSGQLAAGSDHRATALLLLDLNGFKDVNDSQGHQVGDVVLRQVASRLQGSIAELGCVARLGGDEFAVLLGLLPSADLTGAAEELARDLTRMLLIPFDSPGGPLVLGGSIGLALAPEHGEDADTLLMKADLAMYRAKRERLDFAAFDAELDSGASSRLWTVNDLRSAIHARQLRVAFQPLVDLSTHQVTSFEALVRWTHPQHGPQEPREFIALAEQTGMINELTQSMLSMALAECSRWARAGHTLSVSVNLAAATLSTRDYRGQIRSLLDTYGLSPSQLKVEVTETTMAHPTAVAELRRLQAMGVGVAIDDFGTGWSSFGRLKKLPVQELKIDRSFVRCMADDRRDAAIVRAVVALAEELGMQVTAEGVESARVEQALMELGVQRAQGYLYAHAMDGDAVPRWLDEWLAAHRLPRLVNPPRSKRT